MTKHCSPARILPDPGRFGHRHRRVGGRDPEEADGARARRSRRSASRGWAAPSAGWSATSTFHSSASSCTCFGLSQLRKPGRSPSAPHSRLFCAVGWPFICRMPAPGRPIMPRSRCRLLHRHRGRGGLVGLVEALQHRGQHPLAVAEDAARRRRRSAGVDAADLGRRAQGCRAPRWRRRSSKPTVCWLTQCSSIQPLTISSRVSPFIRARLVPTAAPGAPRRCRWPPRRPGCGAGRRRRPPAAVSPAGPVQDPHPQHGLGLGHVVPEEEDRVAVVDVGVGAGLAVGAEGFLHRRRGCRGAQPGVAVHVRGADAGLADHRQGVVLLEEQLPAGVEAVRQRPLLAQQPLRDLHHPTHRLVPGGLAPAGRPSRTSGRVSRSADEANGVLP